MTRMATALLAFAMGFGVAHSAEKSDALKGRLPAVKEKPAKSKPAAKSEFETNFKKPEFELPGGFKGTFGTVEPPKDQFRPGYTGPASDGGPNLPTGGLILKKEF